MRPKFYHGLATAAGAPARARARDSWLGLAWKRILPWSWKNRFCDDEVAVTRPKSVDNGLVFDAPHSDRFARLRTSGRSRKWARSMILKSRIIHAGCVELLTQPVALLWADESPIGATRFKPGRQTAIYELF